MTQSYIPRKRSAATNIGIQPVIGEGIDISLPVLDEAFASQSIHIARQVKGLGIEGVEVRTPNDPNDLSSRRSRRAPLIRLMARNMLQNVQNVRKGSLKDYMKPTSPVLDHILETIPELDEPMHITYDKVSAPVDRNSGERFVILAPTEDDEAYLREIQDDIYGAIAEATGILLFPNSRPLDMTVAYARSYVDPRVGTGLARAYRALLPIEIQHGPAIFKPDTRQ